MVTDTDNPVRPSTHYWIRHKSDSEFHAYPSSYIGTPALCGEAKPLPAVRVMDIPGERSLCCTKCFAALHGLTAIGRRN